METITVLVRYNNRIEKVTIEKNARFGQLQQQIHELYDISPENQMIIFKSALKKTCTIEQKDFSLEQCNIFQGNQLHLVDLCSNALNANVP